MTRPQPDTIRLGCPGLKLPPGQGVSQIPGLMLPRIPFLGGSCRPGPGDTHRDAPKPMIPYKTTPILENKTRRPGLFALLTPAVPGFNISQGRGFQFYPA